MFFPGLDRATCCCIASTDGGLESGNVAGRVDQSVGSRKVGDWSVLERVEEENGQFLDVFIFWLE